MSLLSQRPRTSNLQNRSFQGQNFTRTDFSGTNLRGCNFDGAILRDCNFQGAKLGRSRRQWLQLVVSIALALNLIGITVLNLIFASLGQPLKGTEGVLVLVLHGVLMTIGLCAVLLHRWPRLARGLGAACSGATLGFIYGGSWFTANPLQAATTGAIAMAVVGLLLGLAWRRGLGAIILTTSNTIASYGAVFLLWTTAIAGLTTQQYRVGLLFTGLTLVYFVFTWQWMRDLEGQITTFGGTSFRNADLTGANFANVRWGKTQLQGAIAQALTGQFAPPSKPKT